MITKRDFIMHGSCFCATKYSQVGILISDAWKYIKDNKFLDDQ